MKRASTSPLIKNDDESSRQEEKDEEDEGFLKFSNGIRNHNTATVGCMTFYSRRRHSRKSEHMEMQEQKNKTSSVGRQQKEKWALQDVIDKQSKHSNQSMTPSKLENVAQMFAPRWAPPLEMLAVGWLGDWRPSAILEVLKALTRSTYFSSSAETDRIIAQLIREFRIEEAIIDEEMAEIQATCILCLPFRPANGPTTSSNGPGEDCVQSQLKKIKQVITKAHQLRRKVLELVMNKVLSQEDAGQFLVAFSGTQDLIHQFAAQQKLQKGPVSVSVKALAAV